MSQPNTEIQAADILAAALLLLVDDRYGKEDQFLAGLHLALGRALAQLAGLNPNVLESTRPLIENCEQMVALKLWDVIAREVAEEAEAEGGAN